MQPRRARLEQLPAERGHHVQAFGYQVLAERADYLHVVLSSPDGPFGTRDYRISLEAAPLDAQRTFRHMSHSYEPGVAARMAMRYYLAVEAYLGALDEPPGERLEKRLHDRHAAIERYPSCASSSATNT